MRTSMVSYFCTAWILQNQLYFSILTSTQRRYHITPLLCLTSCQHLWKTWTFPGKIVPIYSGLFHRKDCAGARGAISVSLFFIPFLLCSSRSLGSRHASRAVSFILGLPYIIWEPESALSLPTCPGSSGVRANVHVRILVLLEKWWWAKMLAGSEGLNVQISIFFFARVAFSLHLIHIDFISYVSSAVIFQEKYKSYHEFICHMGCPKRKIKS